jgi:acetyl-CoA carboxylase carboxyltransferase component
VSKPKLEKPKATESVPAPSREWAPELEEIERRQEIAHQLGGAESIARQHSLGKMTVRERIDCLLDKASFREFGALTGKVAYGKDGVRESFIPSNAVVGVGRIDRRKVCISADDFTIRGGSSESTNSDKWIYIERFALETKTPLVRLVDTAGGSVKLLDQQQATKIPGYNNWPVVPLLDTVPVVGVAMGSCAGLGAFKVLASHFSIMVRDTSQVFAAGPPVVKQAFGVDIDKNSLGGYEIHSRHSGIVDNEAEDEAEALRQVRRFLSYMPRNIWSEPPRIACDDDPNREEPWLDDAIPRDRRKAFDPRKILDAVVDRESFFETGRYHGKSIVTGLARLNGVPVGIMASDPRFHAGSMTVQAANKCERLIEMCDLFHLPIINFVDQPGNMTGLEAEMAGTLLGAVRVFKMIERVRTPWVSIMMRRAFGLAGGLHGPQYGMTGLALNHRFAWPSARWGSIPIEGGVAAAYRRDIEGAENPTERRRELEEHYNRLGSPFRTAERFGVVDIIAPRTTRRVLCEWMDDCAEMIRMQAAGLPHRR